MKARIASLCLGGALLTASGCNLHPPYGAFNDNVSPVPSVGKFTHCENLPPAAMLMHPGPGVDGPGPGVLASMGGPAPAMMAMAVSQIAFLSPDGMTVAWDVGEPGAFDSEPLVAPGRYNFPQGAIYRLKISNVPNRPGVELYPTLEVGPPSPRTEAYLAHNAIPVQFTEEDFDQVLSGNFVTKVIYLPDAEFQELALAGVETLVSTRLDPGIDPIVEADRRGSIMAIVRVGNKDLEIPGGDGSDGGGVVQASYGAPIGGGPGMGCPPGGVGCGPGINGPLPPGFVAGVTAPQYGMPYVGTPIGLPGPPHVPLGHPAGLQSHTMKNHTKFHIPAPVKDFKVHVKQSPGLSYPKPASNVYIHEHTHAPPVKFKQPCTDMHEHAMDVGDPGMCPPGPGGYCPPQ